MARKEIRVAKLDMYDLEIHGSIILDWNLEQF